MLYTKINDEKRYGDLVKKEEVIENLIISTLDWNKIPTQLDTDVIKKLETLMWCYLLLLSFNIEQSESAWNAFMRQLSNEFKKQIIDAILNKWETLDVPYTLSIEIDKIKHHNNSIIDVVIAPKIPPYFLSSDLKSLKDKVQKYKKCERKKETIRYQIKKYLENMGLGIWYIEPHTELDPLEKEYKSEFEKRINELRGIKPDGSKSTIDDKINVVIELSELGDEAAVLPLIESYDSNFDIDFRSAVIDALGKFKTNEAIKKLEDIAQNEKEESLRSRSEEYTHVEGLNPKT